MKKIFKAISAIVISFIFVFQSFAINPPTNLKVDSSTENSINLSWDIIEEASFYYIYYDKKSWLTSWYDMQTDFVESNNIQINGLEKGDTYYFTVVSLNQNWEESVFSNEVVVNMISTSPSDITISADFALDWIKVINYDKLELDFTNDLDVSVDAIREFKIVNKNDNLDTFDVISNNINIDDNSKIELDLDRNLEIWGEYEVVIIAITSIDWNVIESWIDNVETFIVEEIIELNAASENTTEETVTTQWTENATWPTWANIDSNQIENTALWLAVDSSTLPKTWPGYILILIFSIILSMLIFIVKFKRS